MLENIKEDEIFKDIPNYEGLYQVSNYGRVWSIHNQRILKPAVSHNGYNRIYLKCKNGKYKNERVARLVALTFIPNPEGKPQIDHIDHDRVNDYVGNLRWVSVKENQRNRENNRKVKQINKKTGEVIAVFDSIAEANEAIGRKANHSGIYNVVSHRAQTTAGFIWEYATNY